MMTSGALYERVAFDAPVAQTNGYGGVLQGWQEAFETRAKYQFLRGGETVQAARLQGRQPVVVTIRNNSTAAMITPAWRMRDTRTGDVYNVRSIVRSDDRQWLELTAERGIPE
jgi:head-tail adaptor